MNLKKVDMLLLKDHIILVRKNEWLDALYEERRLWFVKDTYWAGMSSIEHCESINAWLFLFIYFIF